MQLNQATDYAFRAVMYLTRFASDNEIVSAQVIAEKEEVPMRFLLKIMRSLIKAGIVKSYRGVDGGYALAKPPEQITLLDVVEALEGPIRINRCLVDPEYCSKHWSQYCSIHQVLNGVQTKIITELGSHNFAELAHKV